MLLLCLLCCRGAPIRIGASVESKNAYSPIGAAAIRATRGNYKPVKGNFERFSKSRHPPCSLDFTPKIRYVPGMNAYRPIGGVLLVCAAIVGSYLILIEEVGISYHWPPRIPSLPELNLDPRRVIAVVIMVAMMGGVYLFGRGFAVLSLLCAAGYLVYVYNEELKQYMPEGVIKQIEARERARSSPPPRPRPPTKQPTPRPASSQRAATINEMWKKEIYKVAFRQFNLKDGRWFNTVIKKGECGTMVSTDKMNVPAKITTKCGHVGLKVVSKKGGFLAGWVGVCKQAPGTSRCLVPR